MKGVKDNNVGVSKLTMLHLFCRQNTPGKINGPQSSSSQLRWMLLLFVKFVTMGRPSQESRRRMTTAPFPYSDTTTHKISAVIIY